MNDIYRDICEKLDWRVTDTGDGNPASAAIKVSPQRRHLKSAL